MTNAHIVVATLCVMGVVLFSAIVYALVIRFVYTQHKIDIQLSSYDELLNIVAHTIALQYHAYTKDVFNVRPIVSTDEYVEYYLEIGALVLGSFSKSFYRQLDRWLDRDSFDDLIAKMVQEYVNDNILNLKKDPVRAHTETVSTSG